MTLSGVYKMQIFLLIVIPLLGTIKVLFQGKAVKIYVDSLCDSLTLGAVTFATIAVCLAAIYLRNIPSSTTLWLGLIWGVCNLIFQVCYNVAMIKGPVSFTGVCANFSIIVPLLFGFTFLGEKFTVVKGVGIALIFVAFVLLQRNTDDKKVNAVWIVLTVATMLAAGFSNVIMSVFKTLPVASERNLLIIVGNAVSALLSILCALIVGVAKKGENKLILNPVPKNALLFAILSGVTLAVYQPLSMLTLTMVDVSLYYPVTGALAVIFLMVIGIPVFKDKPSVKQIIGACVGLCAIVLLNLQNI